MPTPPGVGPELTDKPRTTACPACGASARPDAQWCGQCYADFRPKPAVPVPPPPAAAPVNAPSGRVAGDPLTAPLLELLAPETTPAPALAAPTPVAAAEPAEAPSWPCTRCELRNPLTETSCSSCGAPFLADARTDRPRLVLPVVGDVFRLSRGQRALVALAAVAAIVVPLALLTLLLTQRPATGGGTQSPDAGTSQLPPGGGTSDGGGATVPQLS